MKIIKATFIVLLTLGLSACLSAPLAVVQNTPDGVEATSPIATPTPFLPLTDTPVPTPEPPTETPFPTDTLAPTIIITPTCLWGQVDNPPEQAQQCIETITPVLQTPWTPTPSWVYNPPGKVIAPILLYHHIAEPEKRNEYYVSPKVFREQMETLHKLGYTTITPSTLADVLLNGGNLPERPVVITFDDGYQTVYENAFPIMKEFGFVGAFYVIVNSLNTYGNTTTEQLKGLITAGWEIGSHSMTHSDVSNSRLGIGAEMEGSREALEEMLDVPIKTFAYPFGLANNYTKNKVREYGYMAGMGLGLSWEHTLTTLYYLNRIEIKNGLALTKFIQLLPWTDVER